MTNTGTSSLAGQIFDDVSNPDVHLYFASYDDIEDLCTVINWAYIGKPSATSPGERYFGWIGVRDLIKKARITSEELRQLIEDQEHNLILVAKLKTITGLKIIGCCKIKTYDKNLQVGDEEKQDMAVELGLHAVDPDYQSRGIGTLLYNGIVRVAKEHFNAQRIYSHILPSKQNQIEWGYRQGFIGTKRFISYPRSEHQHTNVDSDIVKFSVLTKCLK